MNKICPRTEGCRIELRSLAAVFFGLLLFTPGFSFAQGDQTSSGHCIDPPKPEFMFPLNPENSDKMVKHLAKRLEGMAKSAQPFVDSDPPQVKYAAHIVPLGPNIYGWFQHPAHTCSFIKNCEDFSDLYAGSVSVKITIFRERGAGVNDTGLSYYRAYIRSQKIFEVLRENGLANSFNKLTDSVKATILSVLEKTCFKSDPTYMGPDYLGSDNWHQGLVKSIPPDPNMGGDLLIYERNGPEPELPLFFDEIAFPQLIKIIPFSTNYSRKTYAVSHFYLGALNIELRFRLRLHEVDSPAAIPGTDPESSAVAARIAAFSASLRQRLIDELASAGLPQ